MNFELPQYVVECLGTLEDAGYEAWCVGGCVRDLLMGRVPHDFDVATSAPPERICALFPRHFCSGIRFGTVTVQLAEGQAEVTAFRSEGSYLDRRRPQSVTFGSSLREDASRRDFTINAMAYHPKRGLCDFYGGQADLKQKIIRAVGDAYLRFHEDALRILRAFRFACQLDFTLEEETLRAALAGAPLLVEISRERVTEEIRKALLSPRPSRLAELAGGADLTALDDTPGTLPARASAFCLLTKTECCAFLHRLRFSKREEREIAAFYQQLEAPLPSGKAELKRRFSELSPEHWSVLLHTYTIIYQKDTELMRELLTEVLENGEPWSLSQLAVNGEDLIRAGVPAGAQVGKELSRMLELVIEQPQKNDKDLLLSSFE